MTPDGAAPAVNVKLRLTAAPPWTRAPTVTGPLGDVTPFVASSVATRLTVSAATEFVNVNAAVTVSPASSVPFAGETLSEVKVALGTRTRGAGFRTVVIAAFTFTNSGAAD